MLRLAIKLPSVATVKRWYNEFRNCRRSLSKDREGRPKSVMLENLEINDARIQEEEDRHVTFSEIETCLGISITSIGKILYEHFCKEICSRWISPNLTKVPKNARINWCKIYYI